MWSSGPGKEQNLRLDGLNEDHDAKSGELDR